MDRVLINLTIAKLPEGHRQHHEWHILDKVKSEHGHFLIERGWLTIIIADKQSLIDVQNQEGNRGNTVEGWHGAAIAECNSDLEENGCEAVMDEVFRAGVRVNVGLDGG